MGISSIQQNNYQSNITQAKNTVNETKKYAPLASIDPNKQYSTIDDYANDLFAMQAKLEKQYRERTADSQVHTVEDLKKEINSNFLFSRTDNAWVSRAKFPNLWRAEAAAKRLGMALSKVAS